MQIICAVRSNPMIFLPHKIEQLKNAWNKCFRINFQSFRESLRKIAENNRSKMKPKFYDVLNYPSAQINQIMNRPGSMVFPTDDDDWYHENAINCVVENNPKSLVRWNYTELILGRIKNRKVKEEQDWKNCYRYQTNNYAILTPKPNEFLRSHHLDVCASNFKELLIDENLSIHNKTPASLSHPRELYNPEELAMQVDEFINNTSSLKLPEFSQEIDMLLNLLTKTKTKKIF